MTGVLFREIRKDPRTLARLRRHGSGPLPRLWYSGRRFVCSRGGWKASGEWIPLPYIDTQEAEELFRYRVFRLLKDKGLLSEERIQLLRSWRRSGFSIDQSVRIPVREKKGLEACRADLSAVALA